MHQYWSVLLTGLGSKEMAGEIVGSGKADNKRNTHQIHRTETKASTCIILPTGEKERRNRGGQDLPAFMEIIDLAHDSL